VCGNGEVEGDEQCDLGLQNGDDHVDVSLEDSDASRGCSSSCRHVVQWSKVVGGGVIDRQSVVLGLAVSNDVVFIGGVVDDPNPLDFVAVRFSARRLFARLDPTEGAQVSAVVDRDLDKEGNAIFALSLGEAPNEVYALESVHDSGVTVESYVRFRRDDTTVWDSSAVARPEFSAAALGGRDTQGRVLAVGPDFTNTPGLSRISADGQTIETQGLDVPAGWSGEGPAAVAPHADGGAVAVWQSYAVRVGGGGEGVLFSDELSTTLGFEFDTTGICALGENRYALSGWALVDGGLDGALIVIDDQLEVLGQDLFDGENGGADLFRGIACDTDGSVVVVGEESTLPSAASSPQTFSHSRIVTRRYAVSAGGEPTPRWTRTYASPVAALDPNFAGNDGFAVSIAPDGHVYVAGRKQTSQRLSSAWVRKYTP
jgi:hypothetical protein